MPMKKEKISDGDFKQYKKFEVVKDPSDHYFIKRSMGKRKRDLKDSAIKRIQKEWVFMEKRIPDYIRFRVYKKTKNIDLMRAVVVGAKNTPYCHGLFFFDIWFPPDYPQSPPKFYHHSHGLNLNPNLPEDGRVQLTMINTLNGDVNNLWNPQKSTVLQVLDHIRTSVLNEEPYFNNPDCKHEHGTDSGRSNSLEYNNEVFKKTCQTMLQNLEKPPKNFEDLVKGHFQLKYESILQDCNDNINSGANIRKLAKLLCTAFEANGSDCKKFGYLKIDEIFDDVEEDLKRYKKFEVVKDFSDHYFINRSLEKLKHEKKGKQYLHDSTIESIQKEWRSMQKYMPDYIRVRVYKEDTSIDLMRVVVLGAKDTPYYHGLFFFDIWFPPDYPQSPPKFYHHSHGLKLNPNLSEDGKVKLTLINTLNGDIKDLWNPEKSTVLQVLEYIRTSMLNVEPYFNNRDCMHELDTASGRNNSMEYNKEVFKLLCQAMLQTLENPPKNFEDIVKEHFRLNSGSILRRCNDQIHRGADISELLKLLYTAFEANGSDCGNFSYLVNEGTEETHVIKNEEEGKDEVGKAKQGVFIKAWKKLKMKTGVKKLAKDQTTQSSRPLKKLIN